MILHILITFLKDLRSNYLLLTLTPQQKFTFLKLISCETSDIMESTLYRVSVERRRAGEGMREEEKSGLFLRTWTLEYLDFNPGPFIR